MAVKKPKWFDQPASYWTYKAPPTPGHAPPGVTGDWHTLSPGMRREIWRDYERRENLKANENNC